MNLCHLNVSLFEYFSPIQADGTQTKNRCCAQQNVQRYPNITKNPANTPGAWWKNFN